MDLKFDTSDFDKKMHQLIKRTIPERTEKAVAVAAMQLLNDCVLERPTVPLKEGWLRGSGSVFVQNKFVHESTHGKKGKATSTYAEPLNAGEIIGVVGFNTPYAARLHEGVDFNFRDVDKSGCGAKYMETKLQRNRKRYAEIIANRIKGAPNA